MLGGSAIGDSRGNLNESKGDGSTTAADASATETDGTLRPQSPPPAIEEELELE